MNNNERLFSKQPDGTYLDSLTSAKVLLSDITVTTILENGNKVLGRIANPTVVNKTVVNRTTIDQTSASVHLNHQSGHSTGAMIGAGLLGAAAGGLAAYALSSNDNNDSDDSGDYESSSSDDSDSDDSGDDD